MFVDTGCRGGQRVQGPHGRALAQLPRTTNPLWKLHLRRVHRSTELATDRFRAARHVRAFHQADKSGTAAGETRGAVWRRITYVSGMK